MNYSPKKALDLMVPIEKLPIVGSSETIREVIPLIINYRMELNGKQQPSRAVLIIDNDQLLGIVQRRDILNGLDLNKYFGVKDLTGGTENDLDTNLLEISFPYIKGRIEENLDKKVSEIMIPVEHSVDSEDHIFKVVYEIQGYRIVPVTKEKKVIGIIRTVEIMEEIASIFNLK